MSKDDTTPSTIFNKMVRFVRSPSTDWASVDQKDSGREDSYSKQALKEMIERKRRNDFVRKREFDMLRKLRHRELSGAGDGSIRPSFFQSSMPSRPDDRAMTLKKIDEIEAQMSMQWWKTKNSVTSSRVPIMGSSPSSTQFSGSSFSGSMMRGAAFGSNSQMSNQRAYARTAPDHLSDAIKRSMERLQQQTPVEASHESRGQAAGSPSPPAIPSSLIDFDAMNTGPMGGMDAMGAPQKPSHAPDSLINPMQGLDLEPVASWGSTPSKPFAAATDTQGGARDSQSPPGHMRGFPQRSPASETPRFVATSTKSTVPVFSHLAGIFEHQASASFSPSKLFAVDVGEVQHDPELEEAAIRFANGDDAGAEIGLVEAISAQGSRHNHEDTWMTLFDLYRATDNQERFEKLCLDFAGKFSRSAPMWFSIPQMVGLLGTRKTGAAPLGSGLGQRKSDWRAPAILSVQSLAVLHAVIGKAPMPWTLDWSGLQRIEHDAALPLAQLFASWTGQSVQLRYMGTQRLTDVLMQATPSGMRDVPQAWWMLRLAHLRVCHRPDEFEMVALDFCVTYEVSPPAWEVARCEFKLLDVDGHTSAGQTIVGNAVRDSIMSELGGDAALTAPSSLMGAQLAAVELSGQIQGDPIAALEKLEARLLGADVMVISCAKLIRVDFSAAGTVLNWVSAKQGEGRLVQFTEVNRMVAAFFHVIGISEYAKVQARVD